MADTSSFVEQTVSRLLEQKKYHSLRDILDTMNPSDLAALLNELDEKRLPLVFRLLSKELAAEAFVEMDPEQQELLIRGFSDTELKEVLDELLWTTPWILWRKCRPTWSSGSSPGCSRYAQGDQ